MVDLHLNQLQICHYYNQKKVEFVITFKTLFEFIFLIDQYWERVIFISKGYPGLKIFVNIHERSWKLHKNEWTYPKKFLSIKTDFISAKYFTFAIRTVSYGPFCTIFADDRLVYFLLNWTWTENKISFCTFEWLNHFIFMAALWPRSERLFRGKNGDESNLRGIKTTKR